MSLYYAYLGREREQKEGSALLSPEPSQVVTRLTLLR